MKLLTLILLTGFFDTSQAQIHSLEKIWETDTVIAVPESVLPDKDFLFVSLIDGASWVADGKGGIAKLGLDGRIIDTAWITGLNAPKGMGRRGNRLYVADISEVVVVDISKGKIEKKIKIDSAQGLNDITISDKGIVYVSDSKKAMVWKITDDVAAPYLDNMTGVNGLKAIGDDLFVLSGKSFIKTDPSKIISPIATLDQGGDGLEPVGNGDYIATSWGGWVYYVSANGKVEILLDTHLNNKNTADIGYDTAKRILYVPTFNGKQVIAYRLK